MIEYNIEYRDNLLRIHSKTAEEICKIRWDWIYQYKAKTVLDYGCGVGWFRAFRPNGAQVDTFDIMPVIQTGIRLSEYDLITFWDVIEHIKNLSELTPILNMAKKYIAISVPVKPQGKPLRNWHHYKPGEHFHYFTEEVIHELFWNWGFQVLKEGKPECPPRVDVMNFLFKRRQENGRSKSAEIRV